MTLRIEDLLARNEELARDVLAPGADEVDRERRFPRKNLEVLGENGLLGLLVTSEYGGAGGGIPQMAQALDQMARVSVDRHGGADALLRNRRCGGQRKCQCQARLASGDCPRPALNDISLE